MIKNLVLATLATTTLFTLAVPAQATEAPRRTVSYADLNLASAAGRATLEQRVQNAVRAVCPAATNTLADLRAAANCRRDALAGAQNKVAALASGSTRLAAR